MLVQLLLASFLAVADDAPCAPPTLDHDEASDRAMAALLESAEQDAREGSHARALDEFERYFRESRGVAAHGGVRLSFALGSWHDLGDAYPPALQALRAARDEALAAFRSDRCAGPWRFHEFAAINDELGDEAATVEAFLAVHEADPDRARLVYRVASRALIRAGKYGVAGAYLDPAGDWDRLVDEHAFLLERAQQAENGAQVRDFADRSFRYGTGTLIALLVVNERGKDAAEVAGKARAKSSDKEFLAAVEHALKGEVPAPLQ